MAVTVPIPVHVVSGGDARLVGEALTSLVTELVGPDDRVLVVEELTGDEYELGQVADAARTLPFLADRRVVVARNLQRFKKEDDLAPLLEYLAAPADTATVVLEWVADSGPPRGLLTAVRKAGGAHQKPGPDGRPAERAKWVEEQTTAGGLDLDREAVQRIVGHIGEDAGRLPGLIATLVGVHGPGASLTVEDIEPYLGDAGGIPPWDLTDPIDGGDISGALRALERMMGGGRHPLAIMATLQGHYERMLRLDGTGVTSRKEAAEILRTSPFPAEKAIAGTRRLGIEGLTRVYELLARADVDLRGRSGLAAEHVMEVLVGRLAQLSRRRA
jgi:DNA polymerase-3 subunit delta